MSAPFDTLYLTPDLWDLTVDASGNIALAEPPYAVAQDVASVCRTFAGEVYYDASLGIPYLTKIFGKTPALNVLQGALTAAALTVPDVDTATCVISSFVNRLAVGQIQFTTQSGLTATVALAPSGNQGTISTVIPPQPITTEGGFFIETESGQEITTE